MAYCKRCGFPDELNGSNNDPQRQLVEVEDEILQLEAQLSKRLEHRRVLKRQVNTRYSPLIRLPLDILSEISMAAFPEGDTDSWSGATPLLLGSICHTWRDVAWSMPRLWRTIRIDVLGRYRMSKAFLLEEWLFRSRQSPLSIHLTLVEPWSHTWSRDANVIWKIMDIIARCSERWQHLHLDTPSFFDKDKCSVPHGFPQLRSLSLLGPAAYSSKGRYTFQHAPVLSDVLLRRHKAGEPNFLPVHPLRRLTLECARIADCLLLLKRHPNLVHCTFKSPSLANPIEPTSVKALSLEVLEINFTDYGRPDISPLLDCLSTPALRDLTICVSHSSNTFLCDSLIRFILRSSCPLARLDLFGLCISDAQLIECLAVLHSLRELKLGDMAIGAPTIHKLTITPDQDGGLLSDPLLPNLLSLSLVLKKDIPFDFADFAKMVRSRRWGMAGAQAVGRDSKLLAVAQMEVISVRVVTYDRSRPRPPIVAVLAQFQELEDEGMEVHLEIPDD